MKGVPAKYRSALTAELSVWRACACGRLPGCVRSRSATAPADGYPPVKKKRFPRSLPVYQRLPLRYPADIPAEHGKQSINQSAVLLLQQPNPIFRGCHQLTQDHGVISLHFRHAHTPLPSSFLEGLHQYKRTVNPKGLTHVKISIKKKKQAVGPTVKCLCTQIKRNRSSNRKNEEISHPGYTQ